MAKLSIIKSMINRLQELEIDESINKKKFFESIYYEGKEIKRLDYFQTRSLDVSLCNAKKLIKDKTFVSRINNLITRVK